MSSRTARIVVLAALVATALAACTSGSGVSKEDFVAEADAACREADEKIDGIGQPRVEEGIFEYVEQAEEISADLVDDLRALDAPEEDQEEIDRMIDGLEEATGLLGGLARATVDRDAEEIQKLQLQVQQITEDVSEFSESYGFEVCGARVLDPVR